MIIGELMPHISRCGVDIVYKQHILKKWEHKRIDEFAVICILLDISRQLRHEKMKDSQRVSEALYRFHHIMFVTGKHKMHKSFNNISHLLVEVFTILFIFDSDDVYDVASMYIDYYKKIPRKIPRSFVRDSAGYILRRIEYDLLTSGKDLKLNITSLLFFTVGLEKHLSLSRYEKMKILSKILQRCVEKADLDVDKEMMQKMMHYFVIAYFHSKAQ